jgi:hypothetical protein
MNVFAGSQIITGINNLVVRRIKLIPQCPDQNLFLKCSYNGKKIFYLTRFPLDGDGWMDGEGCTLSRYPSLLEETAGV